MTDPVITQRTPTFSPSNSPIPPNRINQVSPSNYPPRTNRINTQQEQRNSPGYQIKVSPPPNTNINQHLTNSSGNHFLNVPGSTRPLTQQNIQNFQGTSHQAHPYLNQSHPQQHLANIQQHNVPVEVIPPPPKPHSQNRVENIPYTYYYTDYEEKQIISTVAVPVQKKMMNYYAIEHITEYVPQEIDDFRVEVVPEQVIHKRVQYVPVEEEIIHIPKDVEYVMHNGQRFFNQNYQRLNRDRYPDQGYAQNYAPGASRMQIHNATKYYNEGGYVKDAIRNIRQGHTNASSRKTSRTNYVTSDGYTPQFDPIHEQRIQQIIADSYRHDNRYDRINNNFTGNRNDQNMRSNVEGGIANGLQNLIGNQGSSYNQNMGKKNVEGGLYDGLPNLIGSKGMESPSKQLYGI